MSIFTASHLIQLHKVFNERFYDRYYNVGYGIDNGIEAVAFGFWLMRTIENCQH
jgi:hypothetical protein